MKDWSEAEKDCRDLGANLASVTSEEIFDKLKNMMKIEELWIGLSDPKKSGIWEWSDGSDFKFESWFLNEPSNDTGEHCVEMQKRSRSRITGWNNRKCSDEISWVCSRKTCSE